MSLPIVWGDYARAYKAIHDAVISGLTSPPEGKKFTKVEFSYDADGDLETLVYKEGATTLFTLTFGYDGNKNLTSITRSQ